MSVSDDDLLAAEYTLGTLDGDERADLSRRMASDQDLKRAVTDWERRISSLSEATPPVAPPAGLFDAIETRLFGARRQRRELRLWQAAAGALAVLAATLAVWIVVGGGPGQTAPEHLVVVLQRDPAAPAMILNVDLKARRLTVRSLAAETPPGTAYELWLIDPAVGAPRSLGLVPARAQEAISRLPYDAAVLSGATYAVTLEPAGGAPHGKPSGAPVLSGRLITPP